MNITLLKEFMKENKSFNLDYFWSNKHPDVFVGVLPTECNGELLDSLHELATILKNADSNAFFIEDTFPWKSKYARLYFYGLDLVIHICMDAEMNYDFVIFYDVNNFMKINSENYIEQTTKIISDFLAFHEGELGENYLAERIAEAENIKKRVMSLDKIIMS